MAPTYEKQLFDTIAGVSDNVLKLVEKTGSLSGDVRVLQEKIEGLRSRQFELEAANRSVILVLEQKMSPDRCGLMHLELEKRIRKNIKVDMKGWMKTAFTIMKFAALLSVTFGGGAVGANALGWIKIIGG